ncbi:DNA topoisomerase III [Halomonas sp. GFAJ-1]|uniref:DNA topoisomerase III n=1 Tax=Halomonas sp. GFAJ-1 TaxID=1118153 RepID=UPI00023A1B5D|nr:DNA topoisomerase III [Halomonas sp. GFAJ-1]AVI63237.1 DNA topoisomerase III [Halomonas sp. GFAJ-1]EHK60689.1 DNA topoisomerase III [Halomonas sp. GFAJ-1]
MRLIIAEKPSLARAIADALPGSAKRQEGAIVCGDTTVTWCLGHLLEQAPPEAYDPADKQWRLDRLPIVPQQWKLIPRPKARSQLAAIRKLIKQATSVVHAGDPDREGQLLVQEVIEHLKYRGPVQRLLISDLNRPAVSRALASLRPNAEYQPLFQAAQARSRADWLYGINLTRAWTLTGRQAGHDGVLSVGRVQTPVLGLIVRRDNAIRDFVPHPFYPLWVDLQVTQGQLRAWWAPKEHEPLDDQGRLIERTPADALAAKLPGATGTLTTLDQQEKRQAPPLPYALSALQVDAARRHGLSAQMVLDICQRLYEQHKLITYPRSDCRYLPEEHLALAQRSLTSACQNDDTLCGWLNGADFTLRSKAWNDKQVGAHHALAPTGKPADFSQLSATEGHVFRLIVRNVMAQFYRPLRTFEVKAEFTLLDEAFRARGQSILDPGWKPLFTTREDTPPLPPLTQGEACQALGAGVEEKETRPPEPFTDASLIKAMMNIGRYVDNPNVRRTLRDTDGLGTEATRAGIIETLVQRGYLVRKQKALRATKLGCALIAALPSAVSTPERTALWEQRLRAISEQQDDPGAFQHALLDDLHALLQQSDAHKLRQSLQTAQGEAAAPAKRGAATKKSYTRKKNTTTRKRTAGK